MSRREQNIDELVDPSEQIDGGRESFSRAVSPRNRVQGMRAFVALMVIIGIVLVGWIIFRKLHPSPTPDAQGKQQNSGMLPQYSFSTDPSGAATAPVAASPAAASDPLPQHSLPARQTGAKRELTPEEKAYQRRLDANAAGVQDAPQSTGSPLQRRRRERAPLL